METFREEHYEVEERNSIGWSAWEYKCRSFQEAETKAKMYSSNYRIIRCTTVREVVES